MLFAHRFSVAAYFKTKHSFPGNLTDVVRFVTTAFVASSGKDRTKFLMQDCTLSPFRSEKMEESRRSI